MSTAPAERWGLEARRLYLCTPDRPDLASFVEACVLGGVDVVQFRDKHLDDAGLLARAAVAGDVCRAHGVPFVLNDRPDLAVACGADGVHIGQDDLPPDEVRAIVGPELLIGLSTHAIDELDAALGAGPGLAVPVDYLSAGPVVATPTKPGRPGTGLGYVGEAAQRSPVTVWVTGGVDPQTVGPVLATGASHVVVVRYLTEADEPRRAARLLRQAIDRALGG